MIKIKKITDEKAEANWFTYDKGVRFKIRPLTATSLRDLRKSVATTRLEPDPRTKKMVKTEHVEETKLDDAIVDFILEDFEGVGDEEGVALPKTFESKKSIMEQIPLRDFIWGAAQSLDIEVEQEKNSER